jgi:hypothetical protein
LIPINVPIIASNKLDSPVLLTPAKLMLTDAEKPIGEISNIDRTPESRVAIMMRKIAMRLILSMAAVVSIVCLEVRTGQAQTYGDAPWCAMLQETDGEVIRDCRYRSAEDCAPNVVAGTRGFCSTNPYFTGATAPVSPASSAHRKRHAQG